jgi:hypothetical protein
MGFLGTVAMNAIVIGFTPFHLLPMRELMATVEGDLHVFHPMADEIRALVPERKRNFLGGCDSSRRSRWAKYFLARREIDRLMTHDGQVDLYVQHPFNPLSNYAFYRAGSSRRFIYQDGILNYYDAPVPLASFSKRMRQRIKAAALGARFRMYDGHLSGIDCRPVAGGYFTHPGRVVSAGKFPVLQQMDLGRGARAGKAASGQDVLFLDQPVESAVGEERARELRRLTIEYANAFGGRVFYKPHYAQGGVTSLDRSWLQVAPELSALPAEWAVARMNVAHVVSFCSSALANIAMSYSSITCHATAANLIRVSVNARPTTLAEVLSGLGVRIVELMQP